MLFQTVDKAVECNDMTLNAKDLPFSEQVKLVRMHLQLSQEELAKEMGVAFSTVSRWEREDRKPQMALLGKFYSFCTQNGIEINLNGQTLF